MEIKKKYNMTREEQIKQAQIAFIGYDRDIDEGVDTLMQRKAFEAGARWADADWTERFPTFMYKNSTRLHNIWHGMKQRCENPRATGYAHYGQRGIIVCEEWRMNYYSFAIWAFLNGYNKELSIDRIDYNGIYEPTNCRWVTPLVQANNSSRNTIVNGKTVAEWATEYGINYRTLYNRIFRAGMSLGDALSRNLYCTKKVAKMDNQGNVLEIFESATKASGGNNSLRSHIQLCCVGERKSAGGYKWKYYEK